MFVHYIDILQHLANLLGVFQRKSIDFSLVQPLLVCTKAAIEGLKTTPGTQFQHLYSDLESLVQHEFKPFTTAKRDQFMREVHDPYLSSIINHLETRFPDILLLESLSII